MPNHTNLKLILFVTLSFFMASCMDKETPVTKQEALDFAKKLEISIGKRDGTFMDNAMDVRLLVKKANLPDNRNTSAIGSGIKLGTSITSSLTSNGNYTFIKEYEKDNSTHLLFRMYDGGKLNYHDIELVHKNGQCKIADMYIYLLGEKFSETLHDFYLQVEGDLNNSSGSGETKDWLGKIPEIRTLVREDKYQDALQLYNNIPDKYKSGKLLQVLHIGICAGLTNEEYTQAIDEYRKYFPDEPNTALLMIDGYVLHKQYDKALNAVNTLDSQINKDPFLDYYRYLCYNLLQEKDKSFECIERVVKNEPDFGKGFLELIANYLERKEYDKAKPYIEKYKSRREWNQTSLTMLLLQYPQANIPAEN